MIVQRASIFYSPVSLAPWNSNRTVRLISSTPSMTAAATTSGSGKRVLTSEELEMRERRTWAHNWERKGVEAIDKDWTDLTFSRSSGPGGQNVNKLNTKAMLRFDLNKAQKSLPSYLVKNLTRSPHHSLQPPPLGSLLITSSTTRSSTSNASQAFQSLHSLILSSAREGLKGETSDAQRDKVGGLKKKEKEKRMDEKKKRKGKKDGRKASFDD